MAEALRIGQPDGPYTQWFLEPDAKPSDVLLKLSNAARNGDLVELQVSNRANGDLHTVVFNPCQCPWWEIVHRDPQKVVVW
jgi:hypothetical protein